MALATCVLGLALAPAAAAMVGILRDAGLGTPQLGRLASLVELPDDGVRIQQAGHRHLPLFRVDAGLVNTYGSISSEFHQKMQSKRWEKKTLINKKNSSNPLFDKR
jgi:hypothetical protein